ncbi:MAG: NUDIX domain-containing protein [Thermoleophilaceae bacterium]|nr:NUDIX domain-containing protein [Thermoleophilaceae bacterium]
MGVAPAPGLLARGPWDAEQVRARWREQQFMPAAAATAVADAAVDALRDRGSPTHDGLSTRMASFDAAPDRLELELEPVRWALRLATDTAEGLSALCVVRDSAGRWLAGRRAEWVASWPGRWALGAGGAVDLGESPAQTLARELREEWSVTPQRLTVEALVRLPSGLVLLVGMAHLGAGAEVAMDPEHDTYAWWPADIGDWPAEADEPLRHMARLLMF